MNKNQLVTVEVYMKKNGMSLYNAFLAAYTWSYGGSWGFHINNATVTLAIEAYRATRGKNKPQWLIAWEAHLTREALPTLPPKAFPVGIR